MLTSHQKNPASLAADFPDPRAHQAGRTQNKTTPKAKPKKAMKMTMSQKKGQMRD
jgi:hypothetical protein